MSYFNSQPHEEADDRSCYIVVVVFLISTHSLTKRLTCLQFPENTPWIFQLTASRRGWHRISDILNFSTVISTHSLTKRLTVTGLTRMMMNTFQLTASRRGWPLQRRCSISACVFQLTASRRGWRRVQCSRRACKTFQLTASRRGWLVGLIPV